MLEYKTKNFEDDIDMAEIEGLGHCKTAIACSFIGPSYLDHWQPG